MKHIKIEGVKIYYDGELVARLFQPIQTVRACKFVQALEDKPLIDAECLKEKIEAFVNHNGKIELSEINDIINALL